MPEVIPQISQDEFEALRILSYAEVATEILAKFVGDEMPKDDLARIMNDTFTLWEDPETVVVPLKKVNDFYVAELFHGPSWSFKDFGQQMLCKLIDYFAVKRDVPCNLVVSTTGDTGPAAIAAVLACKRLKIVCTYPEGQISDLQERQIITPVSPNVNAVSYQAGGDDMDLPIKNLVTDSTFARQYGLGSVNSINIGRVASQVINYVWSYLELLRRGKVGSEGVIFSIPTGAMGNIAAGYLANRMGVPVKKFIVGTNNNDISHRVIATGLFHKRDMVRTKSEAINIQVPYNFERMLYLLSDSDTGLISKSYAGPKGMEKTGQIDLDTHLMDRLQDKFVSFRVSDERMIETIQTFYKRYDYLSDPHTAVALCAAEKTVGDAETAPVVVFSTAHPCKFAEAITEAFGQDFWLRYKQSKAMPKAAAALYSAPRAPSFRSFTRPDDESIEDAQVRWEKNQREMIVSPEAGA